MLQNEIAINVFKLSEDLLINLYCRWMDERQYEDINDYAIPVRKFLANIPEVVTVKMTKKPFGFRFDVSGKKYHMFKRGNQFYLTAEFTK